MMALQPVRQLTQQDCDAWNAVNPVGTRVIVTKDDGSEVGMRTRSEAYMLSGHTAVIFLEGVTGCYALERVRAQEEVEEEDPPRKRYTCYRCGGSFFWGGGSFWDGPVGRLVPVCGRCA